MQRILVLRGGALGDFIVSIPALDLLRRRWPGARMELAGNATAAVLAANRGLLDAVHSQHEARWGALFSADPLPPGFAAWLGSFDLVVNFWPDPEGELGRHFPIAAGQTFFTAAAHPAEGPAAAHYCRPLRALGLVATDLTVRLEPRRSGAGEPTAAAGGPDDSRPSSDRFRIALHPGSGSPRKNWPIERWRELARWLRRDRGADLLVVSGPAEEADGLGEFGETARCLPLEELLARLAGCDLFLGHDSGVSHLAAAVGLPCLLWFGPTDPAVWAPAGPRVHVLSRGGMLAEISVADAQSALLDLGK
jgi:ADP-heptose:LPS heptosyltransferase